jgi:legumain
MAYDDVASDPLNPIPGKLFNKPNGDDVYAGCNIDYKGNDVTPENFLAILKGDKSAVTGGNGKVLAISLPNPRSSLTLPTMVPQV